MLLTPDLPDAAPHSSAKAALTVIGAILPITGSSPLFLFRLSQTSGLEGILLLVSKDFHKLVVLGSLNWTQHKRPEQLALDRVVTACKLACMHKTFSPLFMHSTTHLDTQQRSKIYLHGITSEFDFPLQLR